MRTPHRFYSQEKLGQKNSKLITHGPLVNQIRNVFRLSIGDNIILFDGSGYDFISRIEEYGKDSVSFVVIDVNENPVKLLSEVYLFASIVKKDNFEWIAQKATELGVSHIVPISSERSEKKNLNIERIQKIITEAAEQSGRGELPVLHEIIEFRNAIDKYKNIKSIAWEPSAEKFVSQDLLDINGVYIGPEGGWSEKELSMFSENNIIVKSLGPQILRAETAVIAALSQIVF